MKQPNGQWAWLKSILFLHDEYFEIDSRLRAWLTAVKVLKCKKSQTIQKERNFLSEELENDERVVSNL